MYDPARIQCCKYRVAPDTARNTGAIAFIQYVPNGSVFFTEEALQEYIAKHTYQAKPEERRVTYRKPWAHK